MEFFDSPKKLFGTALILFIGLTLVIAIFPAIYNQENNAPLPGFVPMSEDILAGKKSFISNGCVACHTQQVRNVEMDKIWGSRPGIAADYAGIQRTDFWRNTATLMGTERTGPDLTNIGLRQPGLVWNLLHLYQPRAVVDKSIMPAYPWLFEIKNQAEKNDVEIIVPAAFRKGIQGKIIATPEALNLVAYLQSLKQIELPDQNMIMDFLYKKEDTGISDPNQRSETNFPDGKLLYAQNCASCHQPQGEGLQGAFPPLKGSPIVLGDDLELFVNIILNGYDARPEYASMNAVGTNNKLSPEEITAIINHERTSWGNSGRIVSVEEVEKIIRFIQSGAEK